MKLSLKNGNVKTGLLGLVLLAGAAGPAAADFNYANFSSVAGLSFNGAAVQSGSTVSITPPVRASAGSMWHSTPQTVDQGFVTNFTFRIRDINNLGSDGFAFVIHNSVAGTSAIGGSGGALGYSTNLAFPAQVGIDNLVAIEFDAWDNSGDWQDFGSAHHVSIQSNGTGVASPSGATSLGHVNLASDFADSSIHTARVVYASGVLAIFLDDLNNPILTQSVNLSTQIALASGTAYVGFTAGTGAQINAERHEVLSWDFQSTNVPAPAAGSLAAIGGVLLGRRNRRR